jgi:transposase
LFLSLPARDFAPLVGLSRHTLNAWKQRFEAEGPAGLADKPKGSPRGSRLPEATRRAILMLKQDNPAWGCERISAMLLRGPGLDAAQGLPRPVRLLFADGSFPWQPAGTTL